MRKRAVLRNPFKKTKVIKGRKPQNRKRKKRFHAYLIWTMFFVLIFLTYRFIENEMLPAITDISSMRIQTVSTDIISQAIDETLSEKNVHTEDLVTYYYNNSGDLISFGVNTVLVNEISISVLEKINGKIQQYHGDYFCIPIGALTGSHLFSSMGPKMKIKIMPYGTTTINYDSAFVSEGINQINHKIWLDVEMSMQVIIPFTTSEMKINQTITLVDRVINGNIPDQYISVPKDEVLNVVQN